MLAGQQFGPFTIDKELGSGAMGTVYSGRYTKTGQIMAIKIMAPGIGSTNAAAADRFEREITILKQLNHPNIVRFYGAGKQNKMRYFAMELIDGESLDRVMSRRGRMTWEEVVELGKQLCAALQHAHEKGIIHRDLKPSNIMVLADGTLKLTDFGIAKDTDLEALTATNCTVGTASYMSPEQCKGQSDLTAKSDLYSLGILFYELVTGRKPFKAENAMDMFLQHVNGTFERPSRMVLDIPVWLDTVICQLLEKKPEQRPLDAKMVATTLGTIQEKFEAQQSAGVEAVRRRVIDRTPGQKRLAEEDKDVARVLMTGKGRPKRKRVQLPFYQKVWFQAVGIVLALSFVGLLLYLAFRPPSANTLYRQAKAVMESGDFEKQESALEREGAIGKYIYQYGKQDSEQTQEVRRWKKQIEIAGLERQLERHIKQVRDKSRFRVPPEGKAEEAAFAAVEAEDSGDRKKATDRWQSVKELEKTATPWANIAENHLSSWKQLDGINVNFKIIYDNISNPSQGEPKFEDEKERLAFLGWRARNSRVGDNGLALAKFKALRDVTVDDPGEGKLLYLYAVWNIRELGEATTERESLKKKIQEQFEMVQDQLNQRVINKSTARLIPLDVVALYSQDTNMEGVVKEAEQFLKKLSPN